MKRFTIILLLWVYAAVAGAFVVSPSSRPAKKNEDGLQLVMVSERRTITSTTRSITSSRARATPLYMIKNIFGGDGITSTTDSKLPQLPRDVKEAVSKCREATQAALSDRISRMTVDFPVGTKFGVEKGGTRKKRQGADDSSNDNANTPTQQDLQKSDRELARIFVEMFQPVGGENLVVAFNTVEEADAAKKQWKGDASAASRILSMDRRKSSSANKAKKKQKSKQRKSAKGFAAKLAAEIDDDGADGDSSISGSAGGPFQLPENAEVALFVAPGARERVIIEKICEQVGMGTLVVLLNARLWSSSSSTGNFGTEAARQLFLQDFETVFSLGAAFQEASPGCLLYRSYADGGRDWILARKPSVGQPKTILVQATRPTEEECKEASDALELTEVEKNVERAMENVAGWFR